MQPRNELPLCVGNACVHTHKCVCHSKTKLRYLKECADILVTPITNIIKEEEGSFQNCFKTAYVTPSFEDT